MLRDKLNLALIAGIVMAICGILVFSSASIVKAVGTETTIEIVGKGADTPVGTITFPQGEPSDIISAPYSNVDSGDPQFLDANNSEPVVRLKNTSVGTLRVWLEITGWTDNAVASQRYELVTDGTTTVNAVATTLSSDGTSATVDTTETLLTGAYGALYLEITLSSQYGKSGTSTLTILGE